MDSNPSRSRFSVTRALLVIAATALATYFSVAVAQTPPEAQMKQGSRHERGVADSNVSLYDGSLSTQIQIDVPEFRTITPRLAVSYNSNSPNGIAGVGWGITGFSVIERVSPGMGSPRLNAAETADRFLLDGQELMVDTSLAGTHSTVRQSFLRIRRTQSGWDVTDSIGTVTSYEPILQSSSAVAKWGVKQVRDTHGNVVNYGWWCDTAGNAVMECYPSSISYGSVLVQLTWLARPDVDNYANGAALGERAFRLGTIVVNSGGSLRSRYRFNYTISPRTGRSLLTSATVVGRDGVSELPTTAFTYTSEAPGLHQAQDVSTSYGLTAGIWRAGVTDVHDFNGDGRDDILLRYQPNAAYLIYANPAGGFFNAQNITTLYGMALVDWNTGGLVFGDYNGDGRTDLIVRSYPIWNTSQPKPWRVYLLLADPAGGFKNRQDITNSYGMTISGWEYARVWVGDFNGDGRDDLLNVNRPSFTVGQPNPATARILWGATNGFESQASNITTASGMSADLWSRLDPTVADFNGDGKTDLLLRNNSQFDTLDRSILYAGPTSGSAVFQSRMAITTLYGVAANQWSDAEMLITDINGDGRSDILLQKKSTNAYSYPTVVLFSAGGVVAATAFYYSQDITNRCGMTSDIWRNSDLIPGDFNNDRKADLIIRKPSVPGATYLLTSFGAECSPVVDVSTAYGMTAYGWSFAQLQVGDFDGDGDSDLFAKETGEPLSVSTRILRAKGDFGDLMTKMSNGYGGVHEYVFEPSSTWTNTNNPSVTQTVIAMLSTDGRGWSSARNFEYAGGAWDRADRRRLGFRYVKETEPLGAYKETYFYQGRAFMLGWIEEERSYSTGGALFERRYLQRTATTSWPAQANLILEDESTCNGDATCRTRRSEFTYDAYGNITNKYEHGELTVTGDERTTAFHYSANTAMYIVGLPSREARYVGIGTSGILAFESITWYDGATSHLTPPITGNATSKHIRDSNGSYLTTTVTYDAEGNEIQSISPEGRISTTAWSTPNRLFPSAETNALGHTISYTWDPVCQAKSTTIDPNLAQTIWEYDAFCRKSAELRADGGYSKWDRLNFGNPVLQAVRERERDGTADDLWKTTYFDGLGRVYKVVAEGDRTIETAYDANGRILSVTSPYSAGEQKVATSYSYDVLSRPISVTHPDGATVSIMYDDWAYTVCDEQGRPRTARYDAYDRLSISREYVGKACQLNPAGTVGVDIFNTSITYDALDRIISVVDSGGNVTTRTYDLPGRLTTLSTPDHGLSRYEYSPDGHMIKHTDAKNAVVRYEYDAIGRKRKTMNATGGVIYEYMYDEHGHDFGIGRLTSATYYRGSIWVNYDAVGRETDKYRAIGLPPMQSASTMLPSLQISASAPPSFPPMFHVGRTYDYAGRVSQLTYPDGEVVNYSYDSAGRVMSVGNYVTSASYNARDQLLSRTLGNGAVESFQYNANRHWLERIRTVVAGATVQDVSIGWNSRSLVTSKTNAIDAGDAWTYVYDDQRRLRAASSSNASWSESYNFDALGRFTSKSGTGTFAYASPGNRPLHAPTSIGGSSLTYDANGRLVSGMGVSVTYDLLGLPRDVNGELQDYDMDGALVMSNKVVYDQNYNELERHETKYVDDLWERNTGTLAEDVSYYYFGETRIAKRGTATGLAYLHQDVNNSTSVTTNAAGQVTSRAVYSPFGATISTSGTAQTRIRFAGQRLEHSGLYRMGARHMSPVLGLFTSPDPSDAPNPEFPQTLNVYAYADNSPISLVDPSGFQSQEAKSCRCTQATPSKRAWEYHPTYMAYQQIKASTGNLLALAQAPVINEYSGMPERTNIFTGDVLTPKDIQDVKFEVLTSVVVPARATLAVEKQTVWSLPYFIRGMRIEQRIGGNLPRSYRVVDLEDAKNSVVVSIKSLDLDAKTYQKQSALESRLRGYVNVLSRFQGASFSGKSLGPENWSGGKVLHVAVPHQGNAMQREVMQDIMQYGKSKNVTVEFVEIR